MARSRLCCNVLSQFRLEIYAILRRKLVDGGEIEGQSSQGAMRLHKTLQDLSCLRLSAFTNLSQAYLRTS